MTVMRALFLLVAVLIAIGIYLTGLDTIHWFMYVPLGALVFAGVTGICPSMFLLKACGLQCKMDQGHVNH